MLVVLISFGIIWDLRRCLRGNEFEESEFCFLHIALWHMGGFLFSMVLIVLYIVSAEI